jgi:hypothetical protein
LFPTPDALESVRYCMAIGKTSALSPAVVALLLGE